MTHILLIDPHKEMILHNLPVYQNSDVHRIEGFIKMLEEEHPDIERVLLSMGTVRIMEPGEPIPIPLQPGKGLVIPGGGGAVLMSEKKEDLITVLNTVMLAALMLHSFQII